VIVIGDVNKLETLLLPRRWLRNEFHIKWSVRFIFESKWKY
jgi:hypothetical protein